jgi:5-deoxy-5-amino-3-dehydroquinate synthase
MLTIPVALETSGYEVFVGHGVRHHLAALIAELPNRPKKVAVITESSIVDAGWLDCIDEINDHQVLVIDGGEAKKSLSTVEGLCRDLVTGGFSRNDLIVGLGGGIITDIAGFVAAIYHRGVRYISVATTLLAQVDAAVGGKTAVNLPEGKNLVGAFWQPTAVLCDTQVLTTLPPREWACGRGEIAKYALLRGEGGRELIDLDLHEQVAACVADKALVVVGDEREHGRRALLNYGHTLGHALEALDLERGAEALDLRHGEAVAIGLSFAAQLAYDLGRIGESRVHEHRTILGALDLESRLPSGLSATELVDLMGRDKKADHDLTFILDGPNGIEVVKNLDPQVVRSSLERMGAQP